MKSFPNNKASEGNIPSHILKQSRFTDCKLANFINGAIIKGIFPDSCKVSNIILLS